MITCPMSNLTCNCIFSGAKAPSILPRELGSRDLSESFKLRPPVKKSLSTVRWATCQNSGTKSDPFSCCVFQNHNPHAMPSSISCVKLCFLFSVSFCTSVERRLNGASGIFFPFDHRDHHRSQERSAGLKMDHVPSSQICASSDNFWTQLVPCSCSTHMITWKFYFVSLVL